MEESWWGAHASSNSHDSVGWNAFVARVRCPNMPAPQPLLKSCVHDDASLQRQVLRPGRTQRQQSQVIRGALRNLIKMVYPGGIASGDLLLLLFSAARQNLLNDLPAPGEGGFDM